MIKKRIVEIGGAKIHLRTASGGDYIHMKTAKGILFVAYGEPVDEEADRVTYRASHFVAQKIEYMLEIAASVDKVEGDLSFDIPKITDAEGLIEFYKSMDLPAPEGIGFRDMEKLIDAAEWVNEPPGAPETRPEKNPS